MSTMAAVSIATKQMTRLLASPSKIAHTLDWKKVSGAVLSVHIGPKSIDLAVTAHPSTFHPIQKLPSIPLELETRRNQKVLKKNVLLELSDIVETHKVCGLVVSWPVQKEGWCGASAGKVLHTLDQIVSDTNIVTETRPVCLWDGHHFQNPEDEWGRLALYSIPSQQQVYLASKENYQDEGMMAADIAADYLRCHWPELAHNLDSGSSAHRSRSLLNSDLQKSTTRRNNNNGNGSSSQKTNLTHSF